MSLFGIGTRIQYKYNTTDLLDCLLAESSEVQLHARAAQMQ